MFKKIIPFLLVAVMLTMTLAACGKRAPGTTPEATTPEVTTPEITTPQGDVTIAGGGVSYALVMPARATAGEREVAFAVRGLLGAMLGAEPTPTLDSTAAVEHEIAVGATNRPVSQAAMALLADYPASGDTAAYVILVKDGSLAVAANCDLALAFALELFESLVSGDAIVFPSNFASEVMTFSISEYYAKLEEEALKKEEAEWQARWDALEGKTDAETIAAIQALYAMYGDGVVTWMAGLWDPAIGGDATKGGFYYANSAHDYDAFLPDAESTNQVLGFLGGSGMLANYGGNWVNALPAEMKEKIGKFIYDLEDPDGYFYHPQWGNGIGTNRRGRDLQWCVSILSQLGITPKYPTALDKLAGNNAMNESVTKYLASKLGIIPAPSPLALPDHLSSEEKFLAYLRSLKINQDSHSNGHTLNSQIAEMKAAGLLGVCCDYLDSIQNPETGLWQDVVNYTSLSGLYKIAMIYNEAGREIKYAEQAIASALEAIMLDTKPTIVIYVFNPWAGLSTLINNMKKFRTAEEMLEVYPTITANSAALVNKTIEKLSLFRHADGSFSYDLGSSAPYTQGTWVSLGLEEGDVNATIIAINAIRNGILNCFNLPNIPLLNNRHFEKFLAIIESSEPIEKIPTPKGDPIDFEGELGEDELPDGLKETIGSDGGSVTVVPDPLNANNHVLKLYSVSNEDKAGDSVQYLTPGVGAPTCFIFEGKFLITGSTSGYGIQITFGDAYMLTFSISGQNIAINDNATRANSDTVTDLRHTAKIGEWFTLRVEYYFGDADTLRIKVYLNDVCNVVSTNYFGADTGANPQSTIGNVNIFSMKRNGCTMYIDDISYENSFDKIFDASDVTTPSPDTPDQPTVPDSFDGKIDFTNPPAFDNFTSKPDNATVTTDPTNAENAVLKVESNRTENVGGSNVKFPLSSGGSDVAKKEFSFDIYIASDGDNSYKPNFFSDVNNPNIYQLRTVIAGKTISLLNVSAYAAAASNPLSPAASDIVTGYYISFVTGTGISQVNGNPENGEIRRFDNKVLTLDAWHTITLTYDFGTEGAYTCTLSIDGEVLGTTTVFHLTNGVVEYTKTGKASFEIYAQMRTSALSYFDNLSYRELKESETPAN